MYEYIIQHPSIDWAMAKGDSKILVQALISKNSSLDSYGLLVQAWFLNSDWTVRFNSVNREPLTNTVLLILKNVLSKKSKEPFKLPGFENRGQFSWFKSELFLFKKIKLFTNSHTKCGVFFFFFVFFLFFVLKERWPWSCKKLFELSYSHTKREGNRVMYSLAKLAVNFLNYVVWIEDDSSSVIPFVKGNLASHS